MRKSADADFLHLCYPSNGMEFHRNPKIRKWLLPIVCIASAVLVRPCCANAVKSPQVPDYVRIQALAGESRRQGGCALLIARNGRLIHEEYHAPCTAKTRIPAFSITKTLVVLAAWQMQGLGMWNLDDPVENFLPSWRGSPATLSDLASFSAGLPGGREIFYGKSPGDKRRRAAALRPQISSSPDFAYGPASYEVLGEAMMRCIEENKSTGKPKDTLGFFQHSLFGPAGASTAGWRRDKQATPFFSTGALLTAREMLAFGELLRNDGRRGLRRIFPAGFLDRLQNERTDFPIYHLGVWRNLAANRPDAHEVCIEQAIGQISGRSWWRHACLSRKAPSDLLALVGSGGRRVYVLPSERLVIVHIGAPHGKPFDDARFLTAWFGTKPE